MSGKSHGPLSLTMGHLGLYCDDQVMQIFFLCHHVGDKVSVPLIYYTCSHHFSYER